MTLKLQSRWSILGLDCVEISGAGVDLPGSEMEDVVEPSFGVSSHDVGLIHIIEE